MRGRTVGARTCGGRLALLAAALLAAAAGCERAVELTDPTDYPVEALPAFTSAHDFAELALDLDAVDPCPDGVSHGVSFDDAAPTFGIVVTYEAGMTATVATVATPPAEQVVVAIYGPDDGAGYYGDEPLSGAGGPAGSDPLRMGSTIAETGDYFVVVTVTDDGWRGDVSLLFGAVGCAGDAD